MADIRIDHSHGTDPQQAKQAVESALAKMVDKLGLDVQWSGTSADLHGKGLKRGRIEIDDAAIHIEVDLAMMAKPMKGKIREKIESGLQRALQA